VTGGYQVTEPPAPLDLLVVYRYYPSRSRQEVVEPSSGPLCGIAGCRKGRLKREISNVRLAQLERNERLMGLTCHALDSSN